MENRVKAAITAVGGFVPETVLDNFELERRVDTSNDWILSRTGISERRILEPEKATSDMAAKAILNLLDSYGIDPKSIDCLIVATSTPDHILTPTAPLVAKKAGLPNIWAFDLNGACSGFLYGLTTASLFIESGRYKKILLVGVDTNSRLMDYTDRNTCILFGDGAGAVLLEPSSEFGLEDIVLHSDGIGGDYLAVPAGGSKLPATHETVEKRQHFVFQDGKTVFKNAIRGMVSATTELLGRNTVSAEEIDWVIPHQANIRIINSVADELNVPMEKVTVNIRNYGNTTAATLPLCLWDFHKDFKPGDKIVLTAFGAGFTWGSALFTWGQLN